MRHHVLNQNTIFCLFCFYPFVSHFNLIKLSLPPVLLFCLPGTEDIGKGDSLVKDKKTCSVPAAPRATLREVLWKLMRWGTFSAKLQRVRGASSVAKKHFLKATNLSLFWELSTAYNIAPHSPKTANSRCDFCMSKCPWKVKALPLRAGSWAVWTTHRNQAQSSEHWETLWTSAEWQPCVWLNPALSAKRTMKCMNKALWGSAGSLIYYTHVKPPTFILCIAQIQQRIWFGLTYFISIFFT